MQPILHFKSFDSNFSDFEDALINSLAEAYNMDVILTNNTSDYIQSGLPVYRPVDFIALLKWSVTASFDAFLPG